MKTVRWVLAPGILLFLVLIPPGALFGSDDKLSRQSLRNVGPIYISVERMDPEVEGDGMTEKAIEEMVREKLRESGIGVLSRGQWLAEPGNPFLYVHANVFKLSETKEYIYAVRVAFKQTVYPVREPIELIGATTWSVGGSIGITPSLEKIQASILEQVDRFVAVYWAMNRK